MANFDVDAHVEESAETWKYLEPEFTRRMPLPITLEDQPALLGQNSFWLIDGAVVPRTSGKGLSLFGTPATSRHAREKPRDGLLLAHGRGPFFCIKKFFTLMQLPPPLRKQSCP
jgi:hypothetical protein